MSDSRQTPSEWETKYLDLQKEMGWLRQAHQTASAQLQQQRSLEEQFLRTQVRFRTVFEESKLANKILARDLIIRQVNPALVALLGYARKEDIIDTHIMDYAHPDYVEDWQRLQTQLWQEQIPSFSLETCLLKRDGTAVLANVTSILFEDEGEPLGFTTLEDITSRKQAEQHTQQMARQLGAANEELRAANQEVQSTNQELRLANERLSRSNVDLDTFVYTASHDLKSPVVSLDALLGYLSKSLEGKLDDKQQAMFALIQSSSQRLQQTIRDLTQIARVQRDEGSNPSRFISGSCSWRCKPTWLVSWKPAGGVC